MILLGCPESSCRFLVDGVRTGLNISEQLKTNDMHTYRKRRYFRHTWKKIWLRYINFCQFYTPLNIEENKVHFRHLMLFFYRKGKNTQAANKICAVYGEDVVTERTVRSGLLDLKQ